MLKYLTQLIITSTGQKAATSGGWDGYILKKHSDSWELTTIELIEMVEKHNTLITKNNDTYFCILNGFIQSL